MLGTVISWLAARDRNVLVAAYLVPGLAGAVLFQPVVREVIWEL
jgi:hypothetical protein